MEDKFEIGKTYHVKTRLYEGGYVVTGIRNANLRQYGSEVKQVVEYKPISGRLLDEDDYDDENEFGIPSEFADKSTLID